MGEPIFVVVKHEQPNKLRIARCCLATAILLLAFVKLNVTITKEECTKGE